MNGHGALRMGGREWGLLLVLSILWGGSFFFYKVLVTEVPPFTVVLGRVGLAALALNALLLVQHADMLAMLQRWRPFLVLGLLNNVIPFSLIAFGETRISSGLASILNATTSVFTVLAAHGLTDNEKLDWGKGAGVLLGLLGAVVLIGPTAFSISGHAAAVGEVACLLAAITYSFAVIYGRRFRGMVPLQVATGQVTASTALLIPPVVVVDRPWLLPMPSLEVWAAWLGLALLSTALAFVIYFRILAAAGATNLVLVTFLLPASALLLGFTFLGEAITPQALAGMALIGLGLAAIDGRLWTALVRLPTNRLRTSERLGGDK